MGRATDATRGDLAMLGSWLNDADGDIWTVTLRTLASPYPGMDPLCVEHKKTAAAQVYESIDRDGSPAIQHSHDFVETFVSVYGLDSTDDIDDLLDRESHERDSYTGRVKMKDERGEIELLDEMLETVRAGKPERDDDYNHD